MESSENNLIGSHFRDHSKLPPPIHFAQEHSHTLWSSQELLVSVILANSKMIDGCQVQANSLVSFIKAWLSIANYTH